MRKIAMKARGSVLKWPIWTKPFTKSTKRSSTWRNSRKL